MEHHLSPNIYKRQKILYQHTGYQPGDEDYLFEKLNNMQIQIKLLAIFICLSLYLNLKIPLFMEVLKYSQCLNDEGLNFIPSDNFRSIII